VQRLALSPDGGLYFPCSLTYNKPNVINRKSTFPATASSVSDVLASYKSGFGRDFWR